MDYHLKSHWKVTVTMKAWIDGQKYDFSFDFMSSTDEAWIEIVRAAKILAKDHLGHTGYEITNISLVNID